MSISKEKIEAIQHIIATVYAAQNALKALAPEYKWTGLGNLLGDYGELVAIEHYDLIKASTSSQSFDATTKTGKTVQIKANHSASSIGFRGEADLLLVIGVSDNGQWEEIYYGDFNRVKQQASYSARDNKFAITVSKLRRISST